VQQQQYYCLNADAEYGSKRAQELDHDPFKVAEALSQLSDDRELAKSVQMGQLVSQMARLRRRAD
jgi:hypothetical protein